ncbi:ABC transporter substrate-binding protein [Wukongibacter baidiensis]|uniref:ABC transporter substrate-binding protein n=1 Tax=Wukongibacter baidiensis TaxID=1723361 RepID=UPI003D7F20F1
MFKRVLAMILVSLMVLGLFAGCGSTNDTAAEKTPAKSETTEQEQGATEEKKKEVTIALASDSLSMDPHDYDETVTNAINMHIFDTLIGYDAMLQTTPALAENWEIKEDGLTWVFKLRKGVKFHNGNDFTADDVLYSYDRAKNNEISSNKSYVANIESMKKIDDHTIELVTPFPYSLLLSDLKNVMIIDKEYTEGMSDEEIALNPMGTGRYKFVEHVKEDHLDLTINEDFWGEKPAIEKVRFRPITNEATRTATMLSGEVDFTVDVAVRDVDRLKSNSDIDVIEQPSLRIIYLNFDGWRDESPMVQKPNPLKDIRVRKAIYHAIDEDTIVKNVMNGQAYAATSYIPDVFVGHNPEIKRLEYDPEKAKALLDEAGYPDGFTITLDAPNNRYVNDEQIAQSVASYLQKVGIKLELNLMPKSLFFKHITTREDKTSFCMTGWADSGGEGAILLKDLLYTYGLKEGYGNVNRGYYTNPKLDELIDKAYQTSDVDERAKLVAEAAKIAADDVAYIPLHFQKDLFAKKKNISYTPRPNKYILTWDMDIIE